MIATSVSRLDVYEKCPAQFKAVHIDKTVPFVETEAMREGNRIHKEFENFIGMDDYVLSPDLQEHASNLERMRSKADDCYPEYKFAIDDEFNLVDWFNEKVWFRAIADIVLIKRRDAWLLDYKSGGYQKISDRQLRVLALMAFLKFKVRSVRAAYYWTKKGGELTHIIELTDNDVPMLMKDLRRDIEPVRRSFFTGDWPYTPSQWACKFCKVEHCDRRQA